MTCRYAALFDLDPERAPGRTRPGDNRQSLVNSADGPIALDPDQEMLESSKARRALSPPGGRKREHGHRSARRSSHGSMPLKPRARRAAGMPRRFSHARVAESAAMNGAFSACDVPERLASSGPARHIRRILRRGRTALRLANAPSRVQTSSLIPPRLRPSASIVHLRFQSGIRFKPAHDARGCLKPAAERGRAERSRRSDWPEPAKSGKKLHVRLISGSPRDRG